MTDATAPTSPPRADKREAAMAAVTFGTYPGTRELVERLIAESKHHPAWRPVRAAILFVLADIPDRTWMTPEQITAWRQEAKALGKARGAPVKPHEVLGLSSFQLKRRCDGEVAVRKGEALACAHFTMGLEPPIEAGDSRALEDWFRPRLASTSNVAEWMGMDRKVLAQRLSGEAVREGQRFDAAPEAWLIRALDWLYRVGPFCPYGEGRPFVALFPGQEPVQ